MKQNYKTKKKGNKFQSDRSEKAIFDEFKKTSVRATGGEKSTGLGLAIVKKIVEMHEGRVWVSSEVKKGTVFSFILPNE